MPKKHQLVVLWITPFPSGSICKNILGLRNRKRADLFLVCWFQTPSSPRARPGAGLPTEKAATFFSPFIHPLICQMFIFWPTGRVFYVNHPGTQQSHLSANGDHVLTEKLLARHCPQNVSLWSILPIFWDSTLRHTAASPSSEIHQLLLAARSWYVPSVSNARFLEMAITHFNK